MRSAWAAWPFLLWLASACAAPDSFGGPLPVRNQHPAQLLVQHLPPRSTAVLGADTISLRTDAAYTSLFLFGSNGSGSYTMDGEYLRAAASAALGLGGGFELGFEVPFAVTGGGFLDDFIIEYHDLFGLPDQDRSTSPRDEFGIRAARGTETVWSVDRSDFELLDMPLTLTFAPWHAAPERTGFDLAVRAGVEFPVGDEQRGYGNGELDVTAGVVLEQRCESAAFFAHLQHTFAGTPAQAREAGFSFRDVTAAGIGAELPLAEDFAALVQVAVENATLRELDLRETTNLHVLLWVGGRWRLARDWALEFAFGEDLNGHASPDFTAWVGAAWTPGS